ncbi:MAG: hypothetical protein KC502_00710 [Myxococcales bacterium]|nr:hypothetical protein [Myxococcales bacterium]
MKRRLRAVPWATAILLPLTLLTSCEPNREAPTLSCKSSAQCPAGGTHFCNLATNTCESCAGGGCAVSDAGSDAVVADTGGTDAGSTDAVSADTSTADASATDAAATDSISADVTGSDALAPDAPDALADAVSSDTIATDIADSDADASNDTDAGGDTDVAAADGASACGHPAQCVGAAMPSWKLTDVQPKSPKFKTVYGLSGFVGKVTVVALLAGW